MIQAETSQVSALAFIGLSFTLDDDLREFLNDYVFIIPMEKEEDHHIIDIPDNYKIILSEKKTHTDKE